MDGCGMWQQVSKVMGSQQIELKSSIVHTMGSAQIELKNSIVHTIPSYGLHWFINRSYPELEVSS